MNTPVRVAIIGGVLVGMTCVVGTAATAAAQQTQSPVETSGRSGPSQDLDTASLVVTSFTEPTRPVNPAFGHTLGGCLSLFDRNLRLDMYDHPLDLTPAHDTLLRGEGLRSSYPPAAIQAARDCYHAVYHTARDVPDSDVVALWPLAVAMNDDSLVQVLTARRLATLGADAKARAAWLVYTVSELVVAGGLDGKRHLTDGHVALARQSLAQLEAMGPAHIVAWLDALNSFGNAGAERLDSDSALQAAIDDAHHVVSVIRATPTNDLSAAERQKLAEIEYGHVLYAARLTYIKTLANTDLTRFVQVSDSGWPGGKRPWLVGTPASPLAADYWFGTPGNAPPTAAPAPHEISLIVFMSPAAGKPATNNASKDAMLRRLHAKYPALQIILMTATHGQWANEKLREHPEREAQLMYQYVHDSLHVPGIMGVLTGKQRVVTSDGKTLPVELPLFNQYMIDASQILGQVFLVDRQGRVVDQGMSLLDLLPRLLRTSARSSAAR